LHIARLSDEITVEAGRVLMQEGGLAARECFVIVEGEAEVSADGRPLANLGPGDLVGEMAILERIPRSATVTAAGPMRLLVFEARTLREILEQGGVAARVLARSGARLRAAQTPGD
jgi:CRP-like cAMP-binding protein